VRPEHRPGRCRVVIIHANRLSALHD
jgi:hypothetical protein